MILVLFSRKNLWTEFIIMLYPTKIGHYASPQIVTEYHLWTGILSWELCLCAFHLPFTRFENQNILSFRLIANRDSTGHSTLLFNEQIWVDDEKSLIYAFPKDINTTLSATDYTRIWTQHADTKSHTYIRNSMRINENWNVIP